MSNKEVQNVKTTAKRLYEKAVVGGAVVFGGMAVAHAETVDIDLTTGLAGVAIIGSLMAAGALKAVPTYAAWGIRKALSMLR